MTPILHNLIGLCNHYTSFSHGAHFNNMHPLNPEVILLELLGPKVRHSSLGTKTPRIVVLEEWIEQKQRCFADIRKTGSFRCLEVIHESFVHDVQLERLGGGFKCCLFSPRSLGKGSNLTNILQRGWTHHLEQNPSQILHVDNYMSSWWWSSSWRGTMMLNTRTPALSNWSVWYNWSTPRKINMAPKNHPWKERKMIWTKPP